MSWTKLSAPNEYFNAFHFYNESLGTGIAIGENGLVKSIGIINGSSGSFNIILEDVLFTSTPSADLTALYFKDNGVNGVSGWLAGDEGNLYYTDDVTLAQPSWTIVSCINTGSITYKIPSPPLPIFKKIFIDDAGNGIVLTSDFLIYSMSPPAGISSHSFTPLYF